MNEKVPFGTNIEVPAQMDGQLHQVNIGKATICQQHDLAMKQAQATGFLQDRFVLAEPALALLCSKTFHANGESASHDESGIHE